MAAPPEENKERGLEDFLDGYFARQLSERAEEIIPTAHFNLLAASGVGQQINNPLVLPEYGHFSEQLFQAFQKTRGRVDYHQLVDRSRALIRHQRGPHQGQRPELFLDEGQDARAFFLQRAQATSGDFNRYSVYHYDDRWWLEIGRLLELTFGLRFSRSEMRVYHRGEEVGKAWVRDLALQHSMLQLEFEANPDDLYEVEILPEMDLPLRVQLRGDESQGADLLSWWASQPAWADWFTQGEEESAAYQLDFREATRTSNAQVVLFHGERQLLRIEKSDNPGAEDQLRMTLINVLRDIAHWEQLRDLTNNYDGLAEQGLQPDITLLRSLPEEAELVPITDFDFPPAEENRLFLRLESPLAQTLHYVILYLDADFNVSILAKGVLTEMQPLIVEPLSLQYARAGDYHLQVLFDPQPIDARGLERDTSFWLNTEEIY
ncbi:MAG: hypothetical protein AAFR05_12265 [Bacteroidota bacterium]